MRGPLLAVTKSRKRKTVFLFCFCLVISVLLRTPAHTRHTHAAHLRGTPTRHTYAAHPRGTPTDGRQHTRDALGTESTLSHCTAHPLHLHTRAPVRDVTVTWSTYESRRVVITDRLSVTVRLQYGVGLYDLVLQSAALFLSL